MHSLLLCIHLLNQKQPYMTITATFSAFCEPATSAPEVTPVVGRFIPDPAVPHTGPSSLEMIEEWCRDPSWGRAKVNNPLGTEDCTAPGNSTNTATPGDLTSKQLPSNELPTLGAEGSSATAPCVLAPQVTEQCTSNTTSNSNGSASRQGGFWGSAGGCKDATAAPAAPAAAKAPQQKGKKQTKKQQGSAMPAVTHLGVQPGLISAADALWLDKMAAQQEAAAAAGKTRKQHQQHQQQEPVPAAIKPAEAAPAPATDAVASSTTQRQQQQKPQQQKSVQTGTKADKAAPAAATAMDAVASTTAQPMHKQQKPVQAAA
jgi:hypothetical protein